ncbi:MAG: hypothetical protein Q9199_000105 [Rusavskia elegans]
MLVTPVPTTDLIKYFSLTGPSKEPPFRGSSSQLLLLPEMGAIRRVKTKRRTRDLDQVHADLRSSKHLSQHKSAKPAEDLPGLGQWYCVECAKWFESEHSMQQHTRGKNHKRRVRMLKEEPYSQKEADAAIGLLTDNGTRKPSKLSLLEEQSAALDLVTTSHE